MQRIEKSAIVAKLLLHQTAHHVDSRLLETISKSFPEEDFYQIRLKDEATFLSLIWHWNPSSSLLTPDGKSRTLCDVANRMVDKGWSIQRLYGAEILEEGRHDPQWFNACRHIVESFNYEDFGWIFVNHPTINEKADSPSGSYYIYDGCHKTLVLAHGILTGTIKYQPVDAILLLPRRD